MRLTLFARSTSHCSTWNPLNNTPDIMPTLLRLSGLEIPLTVEGEDLSILISSSEVSGPGGLFDINATLPLVAIQFILLMVILNIILYSPLLTIIEERKEYILSHLAEASEKLAQAKELTTQYEQDLETARKSAQLEIANSQNIHKEILDIELDISQKYIDNLLDTITKDLLNKKDIALNSLDEIVQSLCADIETRLSI